MTSTTEHVLIFYHVQFPGLKTLNDFNWLKRRQSCNWTWQKKGKITKEKDRSSMIFGGFECWYAPSSAGTCVELWGVDCSTYGGKARTDNALQTVVWFVVLIILKNLSQWEGLSHILWKKWLKPPASNARFDFPNFMGIWQTYANCILDIISPWNLLEKNSKTDVFQHVSSHSHPLVQLEALGGTSWVSDISSKSGKSEVFGVFEVLGTAVLHHIQAHPGSL